MQSGSPSGGDSGITLMGVPTEISGFVLAGGRSSRLGRDKALLPWPPNVLAEGNSQTLLAHVIARLQCICSTVSICAIRDDFPFAGKVIPDALPGSGPLGGIVAALEHSTTDWNFLLAVDLPFLPVEVLQALAAYASPHPEIQVAMEVSSLPLACVLPQLDGLPQPLCGVYHRALAPGLRAALEAGRLKVMAALQQACDVVAPRSDLPSTGPAFRLEMWDAAAFAATLPSAPNPSEWFLNINTLEDWLQAQQIRHR